MCPYFLETKPNQFLKIEKKSDCTRNVPRVLRVKVMPVALHHHSVPHGLGVWAIN